MKKPITVISGIMAFCVLSIQSTIASPTENEFIPCRKLATKTLEQCLTENTTHNNDDCWSDSKTAYSECREKVFFSHMAEIRKTKKEAAKKREHEQ